MPANRSQFGDLLEPGLRKVYDDVYQQLPQKYSSIFNVLTSDRASENDTSITGFGLLNTVNENGEFPEISLYSGYDKTYTHLKYGAMFTVTKELFDDDQYNVINKKPKSLATSASGTVEYYASSVLRNAFSTSYTGGDGEPLCSVGHPRPDGGTAQSNASSSGIVLNEANLGTGRLALRTQLNARGLPIVSGQKPYLLVPPALEQTSTIITQSALRSDTADNDMNFYKGNIANVVVWDWLSAAQGGSDTAWYLIQPGAHELNFFWRKKPEFDQDVLMSTEVSRFKVSMRFSYGFSDWHGVWGSLGDGNSYTY